MKGGFHGISRVVNKLIREKGVEKKERRCNMHGFENSS